MSDIQALRIHGFVCSDDSSATEDGYSDFDEMYYSLKPPSLNISKSKHKIVKIKANAGHAQEEIISSARADNPSGAPATIQRRKKQKFKSRNARLRRQFVNSNRSRSSIGIGQQGYTVAETVNTLNKLILKVNTSDWGQQQAQKGFVGHQKHLQTSKESFSERPSTNPCTSTTSKSQQQTSTAQKGFVGHQKHLQTSKGSFSERPSTNSYTSTTSKSQQQTSTARKGFYGQQKHLQTSTESYYERPSTNPCTSTTSKSQQQTSTVQKGFVGQQKHLQTSNESFSERRSTNPYTSTTSKSQQQTSTAQKGYVGQRKHLQTSNESVSERPSTNSYASTAANIKSIIQDNSPKECNLASSKKMTSTGAIPKQPINRVNVDEAQTSNCTTDVNNTDLHKPQIKRLQDSRKGQLKQTPPRQFPTDSNSFDFEGKVSVDVPCSSRTSTESEQKVNLPTVINARKLDDKYSNLSNLAKIQKQQLKTPNISSQLHPEQPTVEIVTQSISPASSTTSTVNQNREAEQLLPVPSQGEQVHTRDSWFDMFLSCLCCSN